MSISSGGEKFQTCTHVNIPLRAQDRKKKGGGEGAYLHDGPAILQRHRDALLILKRNPPHSLALRDKLANQLASLEIPDLDSPVATSADNPRVVKLQARHAVVVGGEPVNRAESLERPYSHRAITAARDKCAAAHLQLTHEGGVALENSLTFTVELC